MESQPISARLPEPRVRGAGESSERDHQGSEERREAFRKARRKAADPSAEPEEAPTPAPPQKPKAGANPSADAKRSADETDARGRKLDIRV